MSSHACTSKKQLSSCCNGCFLVFFLCYILLADNNKSTEPKKEHDVSNRNFGFAWTSCRRVQTANNLFSNESCSSAKQFLEGKVSAMNSRQHSDWVKNKFQTILSIFEMCFLQGFPQNSTTRSGPLTLSQYIRKKSCYPTLPNPTG